MSEKLILWSNSFIYDCLFIMLWSLFGELTRLRWAACDAVSVSASDCLRRSASNEFSCFWFSVFFFVQIKHHRSIMFRSQITFRTVVFSRQTLECRSERWESQKLGLCLIITAVLQISHISDMLYSQSELGRFIRLEWK